MTWRALILGLALVTGLCWADIVGGLSWGHRWMTEGHFPEGAVFLLVFVVLLVNVVIKLINKRAALKQAELMLIWCMLIVGATVPTTGLLRFWFPMLAGPAYFAGRSDVMWRETSLQAVPETLVLTKDPKSLAARRFYEGQKEEARIPWKRWLVPICRWLVFVTFFHLAVIFLCAILRKQWVDREYLLFPLARVPLEFTQGAAGRGLLPTIFSNKAFVVGFVGAAAFRFVRAIPLFAGAESAWALTIPLQDVLAGTPLADMSFPNFELWWMPIGFAYLVPADVSLSVWFFYLFGRAELQTSSWLGSTLHVGGTWSPMMLWQQAGSYVAFTIGALYMTRRHLADVFRKAIGLSSGVDDSAEPVSYRVSFWGFVICSVVAIVWFGCYGMKIWTAVVFFLVLMCAQMVHVRIVSQSGLYWTWLLWSPSNVLHCLTLGRAFAGAGAVVAEMQRMMTHNLTLGPATMHSFRIGAVFKKHRRLLVWALLATLGAALLISSWTYLDEAYTRGVLNFSSSWAGIRHPQQAFERAHQMIERPYESARPRWIPFGLGIGLTGLVMLLRARFYWWPIHSIGLLAISNWVADRMWLPFLLGWLTKVCMMKYASGRAVRQARFFFIGLILAEGSIYGLSTIVGALTGGVTGQF